MSNKKGELVSLIVIAVMIVITVILAKNGITLTNRKQFTGNDSQRITKNG